MKTALPQSSAFTLVELMVSMTVLTLLLVMVTQLIDGAAKVTDMGNKHMDSDGQARALLDRMSTDIGAMVKRSDVDYYLKGRPASNSQKGAVGSAVNDQIAFYSEVSGYYPSGTTPTMQSPVALVAYRLNPTTYRMERLGKALVWNGVSAADNPVVYLPIPLASPLPSPLPTPMPSIVPTPAWPQAGEATTVDVDYEAFGPQIFRFEYYYILRGQDVTSAKSSIFSDTPWDTRTPASHISVEGLRDVAAIGVAIAVIDPKSRTLVSDAQLKALAEKMEDFSSSLKPGELESRWQTAVIASVLPKTSAQGIRIYGRTFYLNSRPY